MPNEEDYITGIQQQQQKRQRILGGPQQQTQPKKKKKDENFIGYLRGFFSQQGS